MKELRCYRSGFDFRAGLKRIRIPTTVCYGDEDMLAGRDSTAPAFEENGSDYVIWKRLQGHSHIDLTIGRCSRELVEEMRRMVAFALER
jgi:pimeloyl-ACP methyl ester carboxylesterase